MPKKTLPAKGDSYFLGFLGFLGEFSLVTGKKPKKIKKTIYLISPLGLLSGGPR